MKRISRNRSTAAAMLSVLTLVVGLVSTPSAVAVTHRQSASTSLPVPDTISWLRDNLIGMSWGPGKRTGYGKMTITGFTKGCPECDWYRVDMDITNHQPLSPVAAAGHKSIAARRSGFCWPWNDGFFSGQGCWNEPATWNWPSIWDDLNGSWHTSWDPDTTVDRLYNCAEGAVHGAETVLGKQVLGGIFGIQSFVEVSPEGAAYSVASGCTIQGFHLFG